MFFRFPFHAVGFSEDEWETMPRGDRVLVRDYYLNGRDSDQTMLYGEYQTDYQVRRAVRRYNLDARPDVSIRLEHFCLL